MSWNHETRQVDYDEVPDDVKREAVKHAVVKIECDQCDREWYDLCVRGHSNPTECPECGWSYTVVG